MASSQIDRSLHTALGWLNPDYIPILRASEHVLMSITAVMRIADLGSVYLYDCT